MIRQTAAVIAMNLLSLPQRLGSSFVIVVGILGVVGVLVCLLTLRDGLVDAGRSAGRDDRAIVLRRGINEEPVSTLFSSDVQTIMASPGAVAMTAELVTGVNLPRKLDGTLTAVRVRAATEEWPAVRPELELVEGRWFAPGLRELVVGRALQREFDGLGLGARVRLRGGDWTVVGVFTTGTGFESSMLTDASTLQSAYQTTLFNSVTALLDSPAAFDGFAAALETDPRLSVDVLREADYYGRITADFGGALLFVGYAIGGIMAVGAIFAALNAMYSAVSARRVEIATLRALGFGATTVVVSVLAEAMLLALVGGAAGGALTWLLLGGGTFSFGTDLGALAAELRVTPKLLGVGLGWACAVGFLGGLMPALHAARLPVATALRPG